MSQSFRKKTKRSNDAADQEESINQDEFRFLVNTCVRAVLCRLYQKSSLPVSAITGVIRESHKLNRSTLALVIAKVKEELNSFGLKIVEAKDSANYMVISCYTRSDQAPDEDDVYVVARQQSGDTGEDSLHNDSINHRNSNSIGDDNADEDEVDQLDFLPENVSLPEYLNECKNALVFIILGLIFINEDPMPEEDLFKALGHLNMNVDDVTMVPGEKPVTIKKLIVEEFTRHHYLKRTRLPLQGQDVPQYVYDWGERAELEFPRTNVLEFLQKIYDQDDAVLWSRYVLHAKEADKKREKWIASKDVAPQEENIEDSVQFMEDSTANSSRDLNNVTVQWRKGERVVRGGSVAVAHGGDAANIFATADNISNGRAAASQTDPTLFAGISNTSSQASSSRSATYRRQHVCQPPPPRQQPRRNKRGRSRFSGNVDVPMDF